MHIFAHEVLVLQSIRYHVRVPLGYLTIVFTAWRKFWQIFGDIQSYLKYISCGDIQGIYFLHVLAYEILVLWIWYHVPCKSTGWWLFSWLVWWWWVEKSTFYETCRHKQFFEDQV